MLPQAPSAAIWELTQFIRVRAERLETAGNHLEAAKVYLTLGDRKTYDRADEALYNAAVCLSQGGDNAGATAIWQRLSRMKPSTPLTKKAAERLNQQPPPNNNSSHLILHPHHRPEFP